MFEPTSRYDPIEEATYEDPNRGHIRYKRRRFLPQGEAMPLLVEVTAGVDDRLDLIAARTLSDAEQYWQVCDANNAMNPFDLTAEPGRLLRVPLPQFQEAQLIALPDLQEAP
ncbi:MAG: hypothetical protein ACK2UU_08080 [Anaerolineae bacterium]|jgi:hypothetical protein